ncbi:hypothetical protein EXW32_10860 [Bacillus mycoides]|nr:hypothetical protein EXW32_10860 [Bacillus mycoides]
MFYGFMHYFIHPYPGAGFRVLVCYWISPKLYKILYALSVGGKNAGDTPKFKRKKQCLDFKPSHCFIHCILVYTYIT